MQDLRKIDYMQLYNFWKTFALCLLAIIVVFTLTKVLPSVLSPVFALFCAGFLYNMVVRSRTESGQCALVPYVVFMSLIIYAFVSIILNIMCAWKLITLPIEVIFYEGEYIASLVYLPVAFVTVMVFIVRRDKIHLCRDCRFTNADTLILNQVHKIFEHEARYQLRNLAALFGLLTILVWGYYKLFYEDIAVNNRDWYVFQWLVIIVMLLDEVYFIMRYYNLYLDLKENDEVVTPHEIEDMTAKTYLRFYVICGNKMYFVRHHKSAESKYGEVIETPFFTKRNVNGIVQSEVQNIIRAMTGQPGELRFFYGRRTGLKGHTLLRYFYFIDEIDGKTPELTTQGEWFDFDEIKSIYSNDPARMAQISVIDTTRMSTIILTSKLYDERGIRRNSIRSYRPNFNLHDLRHCDLDFQDDKWVRISMFNSDTPMFRLKRFWRRLIGRNIEGSNT